MTITKISPESAAEQVRRRCGANVLLCYQCKKCELGCPLSAEMDKQPNQVIRLLQLGRLDEVLNSKTIWICASCQTCTTRCPTGIDIAQVMDTLKMMAQERGVQSKLPAAVDFIKAGLRSVNSMGRMYELGLAFEMNLKAGKPFRDSGVAMKMLRAGTLRLIPERADFPRRLTRKQGVAPEAGTIAYYPGCSLHASGSEYDKSFRAVARELGIILKEPKGWLCCGSTPAHWKSRELATELPLKNLALVESLGHMAVTVPCAMCFSRLKHAAHDVAQEPSLKEGVTKQTGYDYAGQVAIENSVDTILKRVGVDELAKRVKKTTSGLKVVCYYGCLLTRPPKVTGAEHPEYPVSMDRLMQALGATTLDWSFKTECCGGSMSLIDVNVCLDLVKKIIENAREVGAEAIVSACPMCHANLDGRQPALGRREGRRYEIPVFYFTQLIALALGLGESKSGVGGHMVDTRTLLAEKGLLS